MDKERYLPEGAVGKTEHSLATLEKARTTGQILEAKAILCDSRHNLVVDLGDLQIVGIDNQERRITPEQLDTLRGLLATGKKTVVAMHVPLVNEENYKAVYGCGEYFRMNDYEGCPPENDEFIALLTAPDSPVVAVLTGHLHFQNVSHLSDRLCQYGVSQGITGNVHLYTIGE